MLKSQMYVRCPADKENVREPRVFVCGQITGIDDFKKTVSVKIHDPFRHLLFFDNLPRGIVELPIASVVHCKLFIDSIVVIKQEEYKVLSCQSSEDDYYYYYVQNKADKTVKKVSEREVVASFNNGQVDPCTQVINYEFQNPAWYLGRAVVSKSMNILENSIFGFKELAGSKINLLPHQVNSIMRCLQESPCRYMLADEVGMGKTIEAISIYKVFTMSHSNTKAIIMVPEALKEQWISELLLKFNIPNGVGINNNSIVVKSVNEIKKSDLSVKWDFVIIDEVHKYLFDKDIYELMHILSENTKNLLVLSATPVQQKKEEYLDLLRLLLPNKYDHISVEKFSALIEKQGKIIQKTALILDDLSDYEEEIMAVSDGGKIPHENEDCKELFEGIYDDLTDICNELDDDKLSTLLEHISFDDEDLSVYNIKVIISYICGNYQIESNIIRNRRKILEESDDGVRLMATRDLVDLEYSFDNDKSLYEKLTYNGLANWIEKCLETGEVDIEKDVKPLLSSFFSSPWAFYSHLRGFKKSDPLVRNAMKWLDNESYNVEHIEDILNDPDSYEESYSTRLVVILNALFDEFYDKKVVLFTNYTETFEAYRSALIKAFPDKEVSFFSSDMSTEEIELSAYRFQIEKECRIMLCDYTGGEGRNFQCADYIIHIDLPWDASAIEQRIGRLDRLERDLSRPVVYSIVVHTKDTFEEALFSFFRDGLNIFNQSLSGMEIIMKDINSEIISAINDDFKYGLFEKIPHIVELANKMKEVIRKEQNFDAAGFIYRPMYAELRRLIDYYSQNENKLFASTMLNWASLAGFHGKNNSKGEIVYSERSFSAQSAFNSQLIPPRWDEYLSSPQNRVMTRVQEAYEKSVSHPSRERTIRGTFSRKVALENDYLHFFAPGDAVFDCIVENAINSCKGCSSAFAVACSVTWTGLVFTWSLSPDIAYMLDNGVSLYALSPYRSYMLSEQVVVPIAIKNPKEITDELVVREYMSIVNRGFMDKSSIVHLGKRGREAKYMQDIIHGRNIDWFIQRFGGPDWREFVVSSRKESHEKALKIFKKRSNYRGAKEEMERALSARVANQDYYGMDDTGIDTLRDNQKVVLEAMRYSKLRLESVAFIMMIGGENG